MLTEPSDIIAEGLTNLLLKSESHFFIYRVNTLDELKSFCSKEQPDIVILNPVILQNRGNEFLKLKKNFTTISWIALIYSFFDEKLIKRFDDSFTVTDTLELITTKIKKTYNKCNCQETQPEELSKRETDVLILLVKGLSNKEIADKLNISIHTVISHRKNITEKIGVKTLPGLTIYAISKKIISLDTPESLPPL